MRIEDWSCASTPAGLLTDPTKLDAADLEWIPLYAPGTVAAALLTAGRWSPAEDRDFDAEDWWFRSSFDLPERGDLGWDLCFDGLATLAEVWLDGEPLLSSANMFRSHRVALPGALRSGELVIRCASVREALSHKRPRPRWKTNLVDHQNMRWVRTTLHGRRPTWTGSVAPVGPWRAVRLEPRQAVAVTAASIATSHDGSVGRIRASVDLSVATGVEVRSVAMVVDAHRGELRSSPDGRLEAELDVPGARAWWPAGVGEQPRSDATLEVETTDRTIVLPLATVGFRSVEFGPDDAPVIRVNGVPLFARGVVWAPADPIGLAPDRDELRARLTRFRDAGMNTIRVPGTAVYESDDFFDLCDELGLLVWHDLMFARMDYPTDDAEFAAEVRAEVGEAVGRMSSHPSLAVVCGGSEIGQQAAMVGRPVPTEELVGAVLADVVAAAAPGVPYVVDEPIGGVHPFTIDAGIANYFGVGGYRRDPSDARTCGVRFAAECLAFSIVPGDDAVDELRADGLAIGDPAWLRGVPRDPGASWDFEDVRNHYVGERYGVDPAALRAVDPDRYLDLGRATVAHVMADTFARWRRDDSGCAGAFVLEGADVRAGAGAGLLDLAGRPKLALHALRRALAPVALLCFDEGLDGLDVVAVNDTADELDGVLEVAVFTGEACSARAEAPLAVAARGQRRVRAEQVLGSFMDLTHAYRFGPTAPSCVALRWVGRDGELARAIFRPVGPPRERIDPGLEAVARELGEDRWEIEVTSRGYAHVVQVECRGAELSDNGFDIEPGGSVRVDASGPGPLRARVRALNGADSSPIRMEHA